MQRRDFLKSAAGAMAGARYLVGGGLLAGGMGLSSQAIAAAQDQRLVIQLTLDGGPDFRHLLVPKPETVDGFAKTYWEQNYRTHGLSGGTYDSAIERWSSDYIEVVLGGSTFGVLKKAGWLAELLQEKSSVGAALINNVVGSVSRDHVHSLLALDYGRHDTLASEYGRSGWGGRLANTLNGRVASLTRTPRNFCFAPASPGSNTRAETDNLLTLESARNAGLFDQRRQPGEDSERHWNAGQSRALQGYYAALQGEQTSGRMSRLLAHEEQLRLLGQALEDRLSGVTVPEPISRLQSGAASPLHRTDFARQIATAHDLISHGADIVGMRVMSLDYHGWDSHDNQKAMIEPNFEDIFGKDRGLQALFDSMDSSARNNTIVVINGEFGRQTRSNRDAGTDHGRGNSMLVLGEPVRCGVYGELFPETEIERMKTETLPDIEGRTSLEHLHKRLADWALQGDSGIHVAPALSGLPLEDDLGLSDLLA